MEDEDKKGFKWSWLFLLLPFVLLIRCNRDVIVKITTPYGKPIANAEVSITHTEHQLFKKGRLDYSMTHTQMGQTDSSGIVVFPQQPFSVYDWILFHSRSILIEAGKEGSQVKKCCCFYMCCSGQPYCLRLNVSPKENDQKKDKENQKKQEQIEDETIKEYKIVVLSLCQDQEYNINSARLALQQKGFTVVECRAMISFAIGADALRSALDNDNCQLWIVSDSRRLMSSELCDVVYEHFHKGRSLFIWSDNAPYFADSNVLLDSLFKTEMEGQYGGNQILHKQVGKDTLGIVEHEITQNLDSLYEGMTISNVKMTEGLHPLVYSSDGNVVTAYYENEGQRTLIDGGFTRLFLKWDANTERFIVNCACWLAHKSSDNMP